MRYAEFLPFFLIFGVSTANLLDFYKMAKCHLGYSAMCYNGHGCWCGPGGGGEPVDDIDRCCMAHDLCYDGSKCVNVYQMYMKSHYSWTCDGKVVSGQFSRELFVDSQEIGGATYKNKAVECSAENQGCEAKMCECDKVVVECFAKFGRPVQKSACPNDVRLVTKLTGVHWQRLRKGIKSPEGKALILNEGLPKKESGGSAKMPKIEEFKKPSLKDLFETGKSAENEDKKVQTPKDEANILKIDLPKKENEINELLPSVEEERKGPPTLGEMIAKEAEESAEKALIESEKVKKCAEENKKAKKKGSNWLVSCF